MERNMKKLLVILLVLALVLSFGACGKQKEGTDEPKTDPVTEPTTNTDGLASHRFVAGDATEGSANVTVYYRDDLNLTELFNIPSMISNEYTYYEISKPYLFIQISYTDADTAKTYYNVTKPEDWVSAAFFPSNTTEKNVYGIYVNEFLITEELEDFYDYTAIYQSEKTGDFYFVCFEIHQEDITELLPDIIYWTSLVTLEE